MEKEAGNVEGVPPTQVDEIKLVALCVADEARRVDGVNLSED